VSWAALEWWPWVAGIIAIAVFLPMPNGLAWPQTRYRAAGLAEQYRALSASPANKVPTLTLRCALLLMALALLQPQWIGSERLVSEQRSELLVAIDLSASMATEDFSLQQQPLARLDAVKALLRPWLLAERDERLALVVFGGQAYVQMPFTADRELFLELLDESEIGLAGDKTMIGDAIGLAIALFEGAAVGGERYAKTATANPSHAKRLLLLTDGVDSGSLVPPLEAAKVAASSGIEIYPVALGDPAASGDYPLALELLERVAQTSGGELLQAANSDELKAVYERLNTLAPVQLQQYWEPHRRSLYPYLLTVSALLLWWHCDGRRWLARGRRRV